MGTLLSLSIEMRDLVLLQSDVLDFVGSLMETVHSLGSEGVWKGWGNKRKEGSRTGIHT